MSPPGERRWPTRQEATPTTISESHGTTADLRATLPRQGAGLADIEKVAHYDAVHVGATACPGSRVSGGGSRNGRYLVWRCSECRRPVADGNGWITIDLHQVLERQRQWSEWEAKREPWRPVPLAELMDMPEVVPWRVYHRRCDPDVEGIAYWIDVERARTIGQVIDWWLHLSEKNWFEHTGWDGLIRGRVMPQLGEAAA